MPFSRKSRLINIPKQKKCLEPPYQNGIVLRGYDMVEYHNLRPDQKGVRGLTKYNYRIKRGEGSYIFYFSSQENRKKFADNPNKYIPQFGGFCSWGFANEWGESRSIPSNCRDCLSGWPWTRYIMGPPADTDYGWSIYQDRLYFNINSIFRERWERTPSLYIQRASNRWIQYFGTLTSGPLNINSFPWNWRSSTSLTEVQKQCLASQE